jgi:hypothetical protein
VQNSRLHERRLGLILLLWRSLLWPTPFNGLATIDLLVTNFLETCFHVQLKLIKVYLVHVTVATFSEGAARFGLVIGSQLGVIGQERLDRGAVVIHFVNSDNWGHSGLLARGSATVLAW